MKQLTILLGLLITGSVFANTNSTFIESQLEVFELEQELFTNLDLDEALDVEDIQVYEIDETLEFDSKNECNTNLLVSDINVIELEDEIVIGFDTKEHLPRGFNPYEGMKCEKEIVVVSLY